MEKTKLYDELVAIEKNLQTMLTQVGEMKDVVDSVLEQNLNLELENQHLRDRLEKLEREDLPEDSKQELSKSRLNLEKLYEQGFHVCKDFYGSRRENHEECVFCSHMIYGK
ncbi:DNA replication initiation control protein YabA [Vagococcus carniphilus]|uniref:Replication initiation control protein YabA n=1 Tax=Vagococcus carniphilus TaxID=218144 RepID=A0A430B1N3_9ENTE|nr:DNA replication initiation control protein YabA [Vagococcus carniphilus]QNN74056.1 DNA replication initiation control protein YabA [Vagococcus carniphilus]RSU14161.1 DNA replication initiation control protein YabA [Vagococcus carniphilus]